jgi:hypothetical protein
MTEYDKIDTGERSDDLRRDEISNPRLADQIWCAVNRAKAKSNAGIAESSISTLLTAMRETHDSMIFLYDRIQKYEKDKTLMVGQWVDMLFLGRPQFDALFIGILFAHDANTWVPAYQKAGWAADARRVVHDLRRYRRTPSGRRTRRIIRTQLQNHAITVGVTLNEAKATIRDYRSCHMRPRSAMPDRGEDLWFSFGVTHFVTPV